MDEITGEITLDGNPQQSPFDYESAKSHIFQVRHFKSFRSILANSI
jgi:hypothetical protein